MMNMANWSDWYKRKPSKKDYVFVMDNASVHKADAVRM